MLKIKQNFGTLEEVSNQQTSDVGKCSQNLGTFRKYLSPAVYVESPILPLDSMRRSSSASLRTNDERHRVVKIKKCICFTDPKNCVHSSTSINSLGHLALCHDQSSQTRTVVKFSPSTLSNNDLTGNDYKANVKLNNSGSDGFILNIPQSDTSSEKSYHIVDEREKQEAFREWLLRKQEEKKRKEEEEARIKSEKEKERQRHLEKERENFARWLANKRKEEEKKKAEEEKRKKEDITQKKIKEFRSTECDLRYKLWLKRKEQAELDRKIKEQMEIMKITEEKEKKKASNEKAYQVWLEKSKNKPKPLPLNKGLESLKSSLSVNFINPKPWNPNIDQKCKPFSK